MIFFTGGVSSNIYFDHSSKFVFLIFRFVELSHLSSFIIFSILSLFYAMDNDIGRFYKNNRSKISTPTLKKPVLSSLASHTSSASNSARISALYRLDIKHIVTNQNKNITSNIYDIHSCVTPRWKNYSVQATSTTNHLTPLNATLHITSVKLQTTTKLPPAGKKIFMFSY